MKKILLLGVILAEFCLSSCSMDETFDEIDQPKADRTRAVIENNEFVLKDKMVIGKRLENPYSVKNMRLASDALQKDPSFQFHTTLLPMIRTSHYYVKFAPKNTDELNVLKRDTTLILYEYPLDYEIVEEGITYHDPSIPDSLPTFQYASIDAVRWLNMKDTLSIAFEQLEDLCILDEDKVLENDLVLDPNNKFEKVPNSNDLYARSVSTLSEDQWATIEALISKSMELTNNTEPDMPQTRSSSKWRPSGRITAYDNIIGGAIPLERARVRARRWFTTHIGYTDKNGYFSCNGRFKRPANYSIVWESGRWDIRDGNIVQAYYNGPKMKGAWNLYISGGKSVRYATIHRIAHRLYYGNTNGLKRPANSRKEKIAYHHKKGDGINGDYNRQWGMGIWSDIRIYGKNDGGWREMSELFSTAAHELGHAAHYTNAKSNYKRSSRQLLESWARCVQYHLTYEEYKSLGVANKLFRTEVIRYIDAAGTYRTETWVIPDMQYNFQQWTRSYDRDYTALFIDLVDDYNQQTYFRIKGYSNFKNYPDDEIHLPISIVQNIVFQSRTFADVKSKLLSLAASNSAYGRLYGLTAASINKLFESYV